MLILTEQELRSLLTMKDVIDAIEAAFHILSRHEAILPNRLQLSIPESHAVLLAMPAYARRLSIPAIDARASGGALGIKIVSVFERNNDRQLDRIQAVYLLLDDATGEPLALMAGRFLTAIRTAATSAVATRFLAMPGPRRLAVFGAGRQAQFHIEAMLEVTEVARVMIHSRSRAKAVALAEQTQARFHIPCEVVSAEMAVTSANLICTCTNSPQPLFDGRWLVPGTHINAVGAFTPSTRELDTETVRRARIIIDAESAAGREAGEIQIAIADGALTAADIRGTLADVVSGVVANLAVPDAVTLFKSCGLAIEDLVTARLAYALALAAGVGRSIPL